MKDLQISSLLDVYGEFLSEKQKTLAEYYYNDDLSLSEIAENEGITRQGASDLIKRTVATLQDFESKCKYSEKFARMKELSLQTSEEALKELKEIIDNL